MTTVRTLLIDNYDSFTFNLYHAIARVTGSEPLVVRNDELTWERLREAPCDAVVISPGPGRPDNERDFGVCARVIRDLGVPVLGVCLGHQGIAHVFGGAVIHAPSPMHGRLSAVRHTHTGLFAGLPPRFDAVRYHSLVVAEPLPPDLEKIAWTDDGLVMALQHRSRPIWGVQFHPESICTVVGEAILANFYRMAVPRAARPVVTGGAERPARHAVRAEPPPAGARVFVKQLRGSAPADRVFRHLFAHEECAFWFDSSLAGAGRFSFMGGASGDAREVVSYRTRERRVSVQRGDAVTVIEETPFEYLNRVLAERHALSPGLPFEFNCGYVGYFGYEMKADCGARRVHQAPQPDCMLMFVDREIVIDHVEDQIYLLWYGAATEATAAEAWFADIQTRLREIGPAGDRTAAPQPTQLLQPVQTREQYLDNIGRCLASIRDGESYEICLTNRFAGPAGVDPLVYYEALRVLNPAPYSAFLRFGDVAAACSSPERFLRIGRDGSVETKPIKGTAPRGTTRREDEALRLEVQRDVKSRAENLMIVDLLRNDLGRVCEVGSVCVPTLMNVESYATVHQLVSTIRGRLRPGRTAIDCLRQAFPGGSMTGAPKLRTMEIIDELEPTARGIYSGSMGWLALNGAADLNIVIRTAVFTPREVSIGTGGAIVALSDPAREWDELLLKLRAPIAAFDVVSRTKNAGTAASLTAAS
jgi:para-aminobenzoate synthetase